MADIASEAVPTSEPQARVMPALSATSDAPKIETVEPAAVEPVAADVVVEKPVEPDADTDVTETDGAEPAPKKELEPWAKREITKARNQKRDADAAKVAAEQRATAAEQRATNTDANLKRALEAVEKLTGDSAANARRDAEAQDPRPNRETFDSPDAYESALIEWAGRKAADTAKARLEADAAEAKQKADGEATKQATDERNRKTVEAWSKRRDTFAETHPDYADVAESDDLKISVPMAAAIMEDEDGPGIAYYLGQNPDEAERISQLSPNRAIAELGRIAARLNAKPVVSTKPAPIKPLNTGTSPATRKSADEESMEEYAARRNTEMRGRSNGAGATH